MFPPGGAKGSLPNPTTVSGRLPTQTITAVHANTALTPHHSTLRGEKVGSVAARKT